MLPIIAQEDPHMIQLFSQQNYIKIVKMIVAKWVEGVSLFIYLLSMNLFDTPSRSLKDSNESPKVENNERKRSWDLFPNSQHFEGRGACWSSKMGTRMNDK